MLDGRSGEPNSARVHEPSTNHEQRSLCRHDPHAGGHYWKHTDWCVWFKHNSAPHLPASPIGSLSPRHVSQSNDHHAPHATYWSVPGPAGLACPQRGNRLCTVHTGSVAPTVTSPLQDDSEGVATKPYTADAHDYVDEHPPEWKQLTAAGACLHHTASSSVFHYPTEWADISSANSASSKGHVMDGQWDATRIHPSMVCWADLAMPACNRKKKARAERVYTGIRASSQQCQHKTCDEAHSWLTNDFFDFVDLRRHTPKRYVPGRGALAVNMYNNGYVGTCKSGLGCHAVLKTNNNGVNPLLVQQRHDVCFVWVVITPLLKGGEQRITILYLHSFRRTITVVHAVLCATHQ